LPWLNLSGAKSFDPQNNLCLSLETFLAPRAICRHVAQIQNN